jgi:hypothetical protein
VSDAGPVDGGSVRCEHNRANARGDRGRTRTDGKREKTGRVRVTRRYDECVCVRVGGTCWFAAFTRVRGRRTRCTRE